MGPNSLLEFIFPHDMVYESWSGSWFTYVHKGLLIITQDCIGVSERYI